MNYKNASTLQALTALSGGPTSNSVKAHYKKPKVMPFCCLAQAIENQAQTSARNKMGGGGAGGRGGGHTCTLPGAWTRYCTATEKKKKKKKIWDTQSGETGQWCSEGKNKRLMA